MHGGFMTCSGTRGSWLPIGTASLRREGLWIRLGLRPVHIEWCAAARGAAILRVSACRAVALGAQGTGTISPDSVVPGIYVKCFVLELTGGSLHRFAQDERHIH
jgi:hypothetical protein